MITASLRLRRSERHSTARAAAHGITAGPKVSRWPDPYPGTQEPSLHDLFNDDVLQVMMARDGIAEENLRAVVRDARARLCP